MQTEYFDCDCYSSEHTLRLIYDPSEYPEESISFNVFLNQYRNFLGRIWIAIKYVFNYKCKYGHWDSFNLKKEDLDHIATFFNKARAATFGEDNTVNNGMTKG